MVYEMEHTYRCKICGRKDAYKVIAGHISASHKRLVNPNIERID
jgi:hypothetical protein